MKLYVANMTCGGCAKGVTASIKGVDENAVINIDIPNKLVDVETQLESTVILNALSEDDWKAEAR